MQNGIKQDEDTLVFCTPIGTYLDPSNVNKELKKVFAELGFDSRKHFHDLRHTYATRQFELGTEVLVISRMLGHSDINVTLKTYTHVLDELREATADNTDKLYENIKKKGLSKAQHQTTACQLNGEQKCKILNDRKSCETSSCLTFMVVSTGLEPATSTV